MLDTDFTFPRSYDVEEIGDFPGTGKFREPTIFIPPPGHRREHTGLWLRITSRKGTAWIGVFAYGYTSPPAFSRVLSSPDPGRICVISNGRAYIVTADEPSILDEIPLMPVLDVRPVPERQLLIFSDYTNLAAFGSTGLAWRSPRVCWDGLEIKKITASTIEGTGDNLARTTWHKARFVVDLNTGSSLLPPPVSVDGKPVW